MAIRIAICDDDKRLTTELESSLMDILDAQDLKYQIDIYHTGESLCASMESGTGYQIIFLDIQFTDSDINGVEVGGVIRNAHHNNHVSIVYISWEMKYSMQLFDIRPLNFLIKPLDAKKVEDVIKTYLLIAEARRGDFSYKVGHNTFKAQIKDIIYMRSQWRKVTMFLADGSSVEFYGNLKEIYEQQLQHFDFISTHVSYLVNYDYIAGIKADKLELTTGAEPLPISKTKSKDVWEAYVAIMDKRRV